MKTEMDWLMGYRTFLINNGIGTDGEILREVDKRIKEITDSMGVVPTQENGGESK